MAAIDSLLKLMEAQGADALVITAGEVPTLRRAGAPVKLSMPSIPAELASTFVGEVISNEKPADIPGEDPRTGSYISEDGKRFSFEVSLRSSGHKLILRTGGDTNGNGTGSGREEAPRSALANGSPTYMDTPVPPAPTERPVEVFEKPQSAIAHERSPEDGAPDPLLLSVIGDAVARGASDVFLSTEEGIRIRVSGEIELVRGFVVTEALIRELVASELTDERRDIFRTTGSVDLGLDLSFGGDAVRLRVNLFQQHRGLTAVLRPIRKQIPTLRQLNLPDTLHELCEYQNGLVLMTGPAGSGKSTTLAALVEHLNGTAARHIITLEDPIEYEYTNRSSLIHQREVGRHVESFGVGLRAALRESPDVILVGEMRDLPTIEAALTAAETGHLVLSTLHTGSAPAAIDRVVDTFPGHQQPQVRMQLASALRAVVTQLLLPSRTPPDRVPAIEKMVVTEAVACQIRDGRNHQIISLIQAGRDEGMISLERSLASLVISNRITRKTAVRHARDGDSLRKLVG